MTTSPSGAQLSSENEEPNESSGGLHIHTSKIAPLTLSHTATGSVNQKLVPFPQNVTHMSGTGSLKSKVNQAVTINTNPTNEVLDRLDAFNEWFPTGNPHPEKRLHFHT